LSTTEQTMLDGNRDDPFIYPPDLLSEAQGVLARLAEIDIQYACARRDAQKIQDSKLISSSALWIRLQQRHSRERRAIEQKLTTVHDRLTAIILDDLRSSK
jgi:hypothetical protein